MRLLPRAAILILIITAITGCSGAGSTETEANASAMSATPGVAFEIPVPTASGVDVERNDKASIDYSNIQNGYVIVEFSEKTDKTLKIIVTAPHGEMYIYSLSDDGNEEIIPLTEGDGEYQIGVFENIEADSYNMVLSITIDVVLADEFIPFINPNQFVNFTKESELVGLAAELIINASTIDEKIEAIYNYVVDNFTYDYDLAASVQSGYIPNLDEVLHRKEGICFDYSALVTAMLRSQGIPAKLEIGYHGDEYHAWISKYCDQNGWIDRRYHYSGGEWAMMDPTVESGERRLHLSRQEARDDTEYRLMFNY